VAIPAASSDPGQHSGRKLDELVANPVAIADSGLTSR
jgi:hypothetical protein